jgi:hypothetical protein
VEIYIKNNQTIRHTSPSYKGDLPNIKKQCYGRQQGGGRGRGELGINIPGFLGGITTETRSIGKN